ncbi:MAG TPA: sigma-70 family RNA polymerase sigma factor [Steroidobacteraceae bacterium]|nr:sigma-70 family RNA polymerase sigma factor [Steroidobacteraceae bacterium]
MPAFPDIDVLATGLLDRARAGEEHALEQIYVAYERPVRTLALRLLAHRAAAEDVAQDVFVDLITRLHQYEGRGSFAGWVRSIAVSRCLMHLRSPWQRSRRWLGRQLGETPDGHGHSADEWPAADGPDASLAGQDGDTIDLERALARLGGTARAVVWLHDVEGYTHAEIGALFGATASFSKSQLARAHERLRAELQSEGVGSPCMPVSSIY